MNAVNEIDDVYAYSGKKRYINSIIWGDDKAEAIKFADWILEHVIDTDADSKKWQYFENADVELVWLTTEQLYDKFQFTIKNLI